MSKPPPPNKGKTRHPKANTTAQGGSQGAVVPRGSRAMAPRPSQAVSTKTQHTTIVPKGYTARPVQEAKNYDVVSMARAMNDDFGGRVKKLFDPETEAAMISQQTGIYIGWRCPEFNYDCQRVSDASKCFCGHLLAEHAKYTASSTLVPCKMPSCQCRGFAWIPSRPEEIGEYWFQRRRGFDVTQWRAKCRCKHTHEEHEPRGLRGCKRCRCSSFDSPFLCAACDRHWEDHETFFMSAEERTAQGMPVGEDYIPFAEIPSLKKMVLTGEDDQDMSYMKAIHSPYQKPLPAPDHSGGGGGGNSAVVPHPGGGRPEAAGGFRPVYD